MLESDADRLESLKALGEHISVDGKILWGIFEQVFGEALSDPGVSSSDPELTCRSIDVIEVTKDSVIERQSVQYRVREIEPDGTGMTLLRLRRG